MSKPHMPRLSIIVPSYNSSRYIEETLRSILNQNYPDLECIVMDGGSKDDTLDILRKYQDRIVLRSETDNGESDAINKGLRLTTGDIVAYLDADDIYEPAAFSRVADFLRNNPDTKWVCGQCRYMNESGDEIRRPLTWFKNFWLKRYSYRALLAINFIPQPATFWRRELVEEIGSFDLHLRFVNDYEYNLRAASRYEPGVIPAYLARQRMHAGSVTAGDPVKQLKENVQVAGRYTSSKVLIALNYLVCTAVIAVYFILNTPSRFQKPKKDGHASQ